VIRVALIDDDRLIREGLRMIIDNEPDLEVVLQASDGKQAVRLLQDQTVDVVLMDVRMPVMDGIEATSLITAQEEAPKVVILTTFELDQYVFDALRAGASGFLLKRTPPSQLLEAIRVVAAGEALLAPSVTKRLIEEYARRPRRDEQRTSHLTARELEVLVAIGRGLSNQELADQLFIAPNTVKTHVKRVFAKIGARDRAQAVVIAYEEGLL
jgi:DNA-binding NarL/FixJ family response regulator